MKEHVFKHRLLPVLKKVTFPRYMVFTDTETHEDPNSLDNLQIFTLGWVFFWDSESGRVMDMVRQEYYTDRLKYCRAFEDYVTSNKNVFIYGHNLYFDLQCSGFFKYFTDAGWVCDWLYDRGLTYILRIKYEKMSITCVSSTNYYDCSLKELGDMIGCPKKDIDLKKASKRKLKDYCYRDTEIVLKGIWWYIEFIQKHDLGRMALTKASQGFVAYRYRFMHKKIYLHDCEKVFSIERAGYYGGRTEAFRIGKIKGNDFVSVDVNSMYPYVMKEFLYPSKLVCYMEDSPREIFLKILKGYGMIAEVIVNTDIPVFPIRYKNKLIFPTGRFKTTLCTEALKLAVDRNYLERFIKASVYYMEDLFSEYVDYFQGLRLNYKAENNKIMVKLCKYMHNAFYGKWGERNIITDMRDNDTDVDYLRREIYDPMTEHFWIETIFMNKIMMQRTEGEGNHSFPAIVAHITENARLKLWYIIERLGLNNVLYCDTDSVMTERQYISKIKDLIHPDKLGYLKIDKEFKSLLIEGAKNYRTDEKRCIKGIPHKAIEISRGHFRFDTFQRQVACLRAGQDVGVKIKPVERRLKQVYDKGIIRQDGKVIPYHFLQPDQLDGQPPQP